MGLLDSLFDKEQMVSDTIQGCLENIAEELGCKHSDFFVMIKPTDEKYNAKYYIYKIDKGVPKCVREIPLKEILGDELE